MPLSMHSGIIGSWMISLFQFAKFNRSFYFFCVKFSCAINGSPYLKRKTSEILILLDQAFHFIKFTLIL